MKLIKRLLSLIIIACLALACYITYKGYEKYKERTSDISILESTMKIKEKKHYTTFENIPKIFVNAVVAVEDRRFYQHRGVDVIGSLRAFVNAFRRKEIREGGSSITQQLAKNMYFMNDNTPSRKVAEIFVASELEKMFTKEEILELYFNIIYYGEGAYCIYDASKAYFNKSPSDMTAYEATLLAGLPNAPSVYSPKKNPELAYKRQKKVIQAMRNNGYLKESEAEEILKESEYCSE